MADLAPLHEGQPFLYLDEQKARQAFNVCDMVGLSFVDKNGMIYCVWERYDERRWMVNCADGGMVVMDETVILAIAAQNALDKVADLHQKIEGEAIEIHRTGLTAIHAGSQIGTLVNWLPYEMASRVLKVVRG